MVSSTTAVAAGDPAEAPEAAAPSGPALLSVPPPKRYRVGEIVAHTGLTRQTLHNYARWGLIRETARTAGGHRLYDESVFARLARIAALKPDATLDEIRRRLDSSDAPPALFPQAQPRVSRGVAPALAEGRA